MGRGRLMDRHTLQVGSETITAEKFLVCTGGRPEMPPIPGHEFAITSNEAFHLPDPLPKADHDRGRRLHRGRVRRHLPRARLRRSIS